MFTMLFHSRRLRLAGRLAAGLLMLPLWAAQAQTTYAVTGVNVVDVHTGRVLPDRTVVIDAGRITAVMTEDRAAPEGATRIDGQGRYLIPGLWDMHVHLRHPAAPEILMPQFVAHGVTGVRDMASDCQNPEGQAPCIADLREWQRAIDQGALLGPRIVALSSVPVNPPFDYEGPEEQVREIIGQFQARGADLIKMYYRASPDVFGWVMDEARRRGLDVSGHIPLRVTSRTASDLGLRSLEHARDFLFDCFPGTMEFRQTARSQNPPVETMRSMVDDHDSVVCDEVFRTFVRNDTWYVPTHVTRRMDAYADDPVFRSDPRSKYIPAPVWREWQEDADRMVALDSTPAGRRVMRGFYTRGLEITGRAHAAGVSIVLGTDAGDTYVFPGSGVHDELGELVKAGLSPAEALAAATIRAAAFMRMDRAYGSIEVGKWGDVVLLDANPLEDIGHTRRIAMVIVAGRALMRTDLDALLAGVESTVANFD